MYRSFSSIDDFEKDTLSAPGETTLNADHLVILVAAVIAALAALAAAGITGLATIIAAWINRRR